MMIRLIIGSVKSREPKTVKLSREQAARNREHILEVASRLFRQRGIDNVSVAEVMEAAGFTHGGFYNHFADKGALAVEACLATFEGSLEAIERGTVDGVAPYVKGYLSPAHRDGDGCPMTALATEAARHADLQPSYAGGLRAMLQLLTEAIGRSGVTDAKEARQRSLRLVNELVGALTLARAVRAAEPALSNEILRASREGLQSS
jgi:TetR/AcrR family transcriptional regulator, transcriptional repressor for nem operon